MIVLVNIIQLNNTSAEILLKEAEMLTLLNLLVTITFTQSLAQIFIEQGGLKHLLVAKSNKPDTQNKGILTAWGNLLKQLCEDPGIFQA